MGVWIEIAIHVLPSVGSVVTPFVGVWIEILILYKVSLLFSVTPFVGVWIEITESTRDIKSLAGHSLRGSVD